MPIKVNKIQDNRPQIDAEGTSEKELFSALVKKGEVRIRRGATNQPAFTIRYEEVAELQDLLSDVSSLLKENQYGPEDSLKEGYEAPSTQRNVSKGVAQPQETVTSDTPKADPTNTTQVTNPTPPPAAPVSDRGPAAEELAAVEQPAHVQPSAQTAPKPAEDNPFA